MITNKNSELIKNLKNKGIIFERGDTNLFKKYSYFQTINAYKSLFIDGVEDIDLIEYNIQNNIKHTEYQKYYRVNNYSDNNDFVLKICISICKKYGISYETTSTLMELKGKIKDISYLHHKYTPNIKYRDLVRMYKFEHELRSVLLKYTLIIEENMKNIFIRVLNDSGTAKANHLTNISSFNTDMNNNSALRTLKLIVDKHGNKYSMPIRRKREQNLTIPYWILINELAMNQTYGAINNLVPNTSLEVFQECVNYFTCINIDLDSLSTTPKTYKKAFSQVQTFKSMLSYIGEFRNMLAHNQPIFSYNVKDYCLKSFPVISYLKPKGKNLKEKYKINAALMHNLQDFFGSDKFNRNNYNREINLSVIIYMIYKIILHIDPNTLFYTELKSIFVKYNIILSEYHYNVDNHNTVKDLLRIIDESEEINLDFNDIINNVENGLPFKRDLKSKVSELNQYLLKLRSNKKNIKIEKQTSKYPFFYRNKRYSDYTGINVKFFNRIK